METCSGHTIRFHSKLRNRHHIKLTFKPELNVIFVDDDISVSSVTVANQPSQPTLQTDVTTAPPMTKDILKVGDFSTLPLTC